MNLRKTLAFSLLSISMNVTAGLDAEMDEWLDGLTDTSNGLMGNVTEPGNYSTASMGVVSGGALTVRSNISNVQPWKIQPPTIKAGCGGIDLYGGYFSFINSDQIVEHLRAIGQNAIAYSFQMAVKSMSGQIWETIDNLAQTMNELGAALSNSCETAKFLVDGENSNLGDRVNKKLSDIGQAWGAVKDEGSKYFAVSGETTAEQTSSLDPAQKEDVYGNVVWYALHKSNFVNAYAHGDTELMQVAMSLTGSKASRETTTSKEGDATPEVIELTPLVNAEKLLVGGKVDIYDCGGNFDKNECLSNTHEVKDYDGMAKKIREIMIGPGVGVGGLVGKWSSGSGAPTAEERAFASLMQPVAAQLEKITRISPDLARQYAKEVSNDLGLLYVENFVTAVLNQVMLAVGDSQHPFSKDVLKDLEAVNMKLAAEIGGLKKTYPGTMSGVLGKGEVYLQNRRAINVIEPSKQTTGNQ